MDMDVSTLELALAVSDYIGDQLDMTSGAFITLPRDIAELALAFAKAAIDSLQNQACGPGPTLN